MLDTKECKSDDIRGIVFSWTGQKYSRVVATYVASLSQLPSSFYQPAQNCPSCPAQLLSVWYNYCNQSNLTRFLYRYSNIIKTTLQDGIFTCKNEFPINLYRIANDNAILSNYQQSCFCWAANYQQIPRCKTVWNCQKYFRDFFSDFKLSISRSIWAANYQQYSSRIFLFF